MSRICEQTVTINDAPVYQVINCGHTIGRGIADSDLFGMERVTYTPATHHNRLVALHALEGLAGECLFQNANDPWEDFFVHGKDGEWQKIAIATMRQEQTPRIDTYGAVVPVGAGRIIFCQLLLDTGSEKARRVYKQLLSNLGVRINTHLLAFVREHKDFAIETWMGLPRLPYQDIEAMERYFTDPQYTLNNLGEGVFGWMKRYERHGGAVNIPGSAGQDFFLTVFVDSDINRDPGLRDKQQLPDSSIVPDVFMEINCPCKMFVNGKLIFVSHEIPAHGIKVEDVVLKQGINRLVILCLETEEDIRLNTWFLNKYGDPIPGLRYLVTLD
jgi:beta-galactosidase